MGKKRATPEEIAQVRQALHLTYPDCFAGKGQQKRPLKIGIHKDVLSDGREKMPGLSCRLIRAGLRDYVSGPTYLRNMLAGTPRIDLDGNPDGVVEEAHEVAAKAQLAAMKPVGGKRGHFKGKGQKRERRAA